jgi:hypothetical protein
VDYEPVPQQDGLPVRLNRQVKKELAQLQSGALLGQARIGSTEYNAYYHAHLRIRNGYELSNEVSDAAVELNHLITHKARGNPALEANLRAFLEEPTMIAASGVALRYMSRPLW